MASRAHSRARLAALDEAIAVIEREFGHLGDQISMDTAIEPVIPLGVPYGYPIDVRANDATLAPWEVFWMLGQLRDAYRDKVLGPAECAAAAHTDTEEAR